MKPQTKHTPGPWHIGVNPGPIVYGEKGEQVANLFVPMVPFDENKSNAERIVACVNACESLADPSVVPELLAALEFAVNRAQLANDEGSPILSAWLPDARALLVRAKGEA